MRCMLCRHAYTAAGHDSTLRRSVWCAWYQSDSLVPGHAYTLCSDEYATEAGRTEQETLRSKTIWSPHHKLLEGGHAYKCSRNDARRLAETVAKDENRRTTACAMQESSCCISEGRDVVQEAFTSRKANRHHDNMDTPLSSSMHGYTSGTTKLAFAVTNNEHA